LYASGVRVNNLPEIMLRGDALHYFEKEYNVAMELNVVHSDTVWFAINYDEHFMTPSPL
jgi:hypothetical protein